ncbi:MAG: hypothetical protein ACM3TU_00195 [Bacillota bacterium]
MASLPFSASVSLPLPSFQIFREYLLPIALFAAAPLVPLQWVLASYLVFGQAHFLMAFLYQGRAGKTRRPQYIALALVTIAVLFWYFREVALVTPMFVLAAIAFGAHFAVDEFFLHKETLTRSKQVTVAAFILLYSTLVFMYVNPALAPLGPLAAGVSILLLLTRAFSKVRPSAAERYLFLNTILLILLSVVLKLPAQVLDVIILLHGANWLIAYGIKVNPNPGRKRRYWTDTFVTFAVPSVLFALFSMAGFSIFQFIFSPMYWDGWAIAHFVLSSRFASGPQAPLG